MDVIKIENLSIGQWFPKYKQLCEFLEVEMATGGSSRIKQKKWFAEHFTSVKDKKGHGLTITDIITTDVKPIVDKRGGAFNTIEYTKNIEILILDILAKDNKEGVIFLPKNRLFHILQMVNNNYMDTNRKIPKLSKLLDIDEGSVREWFDTTGGLLERSLESALKKLRNQALIIWSKEITVCKIVEIPGSEYLVETFNEKASGETYSTFETHYKTEQIVEEASDEEKQYIIAVERSILLSMECNDKQQVIAKGLWNEYKETVNKIIMSEMKFLYYYQSYKIIFNPNHILMRQDQIKSLRITDEERSRQLVIVNTSFMDRSENNIKSRSNKALDVLMSADESLLREKTILRTSDQYVRDNVKLNKTLIDNSAKSIKEDIKKID